MRRRWKQGAKKKEKRVFLLFMVLKNALLPNIPIFEMYFVLQSIFKNIYGTNYEWKKGELRKLKWYMIE
jgi:hypothetical protein